MKFTRKLIAMVLVICLMIPYCTTMTVAADTNTQPQTAIQPKVSNQPFRFGRSILEQMNNSDALLYAYDKLVEGCKSLSTSVDISHRTHRINAEEATTVYQLVTNDYPLFFWLTDGVSLRGTSSSITTYGLNIPTNAQDILFALEARVAELTADLTDKSDYEKSLILHDRVANNNVYLSTNHDQTVIGSLLEGASVCAGYARAYQLLMQTVGIPCFFVTGHSKGQGHAWNLVQLDGEWYYTDVTWDDQNDYGGYIYYAYLNMTSAQMNEDHVAVEFAEYLPIATATAANYHVKNDTALALPTAEIIATLYEADMTIRLYMTGDINAFFNELGNALYGAVNCVACPGSPYSCRTSYLGREMIIDLSVSRPHDYDSNNTCTECGYTKVENHHYVVTVIHPTCGQDGYSISKCERCGDEVWETIPATGEHTYDAVVTYPDCINSGYTTYTCTVCGDSYVGDATPALGHTFFETERIEPTCTTEGTIVYACASCGENHYETIPATGEHTYDAVVTHPDCLNGGYTTYTCTVCSDSYVGDATPALGHTFFETERIEPTCTVEGIIVYACASCGQEGGATIPATGEHVFDGNTCVDCGYTIEIVVTYGDLNDDGNINNRDLALLQQYLNGWSVTVNEVACDANADGNVNNRDLALLQQYLNGWSVTLG